MRTNKGGWKGKRAYQEEEDHEPEELKHDSEEQRGTDDIESLALGVAQSARPVLEPRPDVVLDRTHHKVVGEHAEEAKEHHESGELKTGEPD